MKILKKLVSSIALLLFLFVAFQSVTTHAQQTHYPISQLGNCRDTQECFYYCEIPRNTPACWSYGKYIIEKNVLGTITKSPDEIAKEHGITFPIPELGNCASAQACMQYCNAPENQQTCTDFGKKKGLTQDNNTQYSVNEEKILSDAKTQLGCNSKDACMSYCSSPTNQQKCQQFAQSEGLHHTQDSSQSTSPSSTVSSTILQAAKQELGCDSQDTCMNYCSNPDNQQKCQSFAQAHNITHSDQTQRNQQSQQRNQEHQYNQTIQQAVSPYPSYQDNQSNINQQQHGNYQQIPCATDQECNQYCQTHPDQCPGFQQNNGNNGQYQQSGTQQGNYNPAPSINSQLPTQQQPQSNTQPSQNIPTNASDQQKMCNQTPGCNWTGSTCSCPSGH